MNRKELFIKRYEPDVQAIARQYLHVGEPLEDMLQDGREGVIMAAINMPDTMPEDVDEQVRCTIRQYICRALREHGYTLRLPRRLAEKWDHHPVIGLDECKKLQDMEDTPPLTAEAIWMSVEQLSTQQQKVTKLLFGLDSETAMDSKQTAQQMGIGQCAVQHLQRRALRNLKQLITK